MATLMLRVTAAAKCGTTTRTIPVCSLSESMVAPTRALLQAMAARLDQFNVPGPTVHDTLHLDRRILGVRIRVSVDITVSLLVALGPPRDESSPATH